MSPSTTAFSLASIDRAMDAGTHPRGPKPLFYSPSPGLLQRFAAVLVVITAAPLVLLALLTLVLVLSAKLLLALATADVGS
jgi:hypothetical protein